MDHETRDVVEGASVSLASTSPDLPGSGTQSTDDEGRFRFADVSAGVYRLTVAAPGYAEMIVDTLRVPVEGEVELVLLLSEGARRLEPIVVTEDRPPPPATLDERRRLAGGSRFLVTREEIEEQDPRYVSELLRRVPGGVVVPAPTPGYMLLLRGQCRPGIWIDAVEISGTSNIDQLVSPQEVEALEVFHGFELPVEYGVNTCGGILVWTRSGPSSSSGEG